MTTTAEPQASYGLSEEHEALRQSVRDFAETVVAPRSGEVDRTASYPWDLHEGLRKNELLALHVPVQYGGAGADAIATAIVIEELSRVDASVGLIVAVNKLGTTGLLLSGSEDLKQRYLPAVASGEATFSYALSEREAGSDAAAMRTRAVSDGDAYVLDGTKAWISQAGVSTHCTVMAVTEPGVGARGISAFVVHADDPGFSVGTPEHKMGIKGSPTCEVYFDRCR
ncbi:MAG: acyl-CoA dehydrogenase family protein, partial [Actinomycetota bacterium]|nr:acyl-CoA dehydrogenase family protein [Actinomycetota bacterium]